VSISVDCDKCGGTFQVKDKRAGKKVYCKLCNGIVQVPRPEIENAFDDDLGEEEITFKSFDDESFSDITPLPRLNPAPLRRSKRSRRESSVTWSWPLSRSVTAGVVVLGLIGVLLIAGQFYPIIGSVMLLLMMLGVLFAMFAGFVCMLVGGIGLIVAAFEEDTTCGLLYLFLPFYSLYYMVSRWDETRWPKVIAVGFLLMLGPGFLAAGVEQVFTASGHPLAFAPRHGPPEFVRNPPGQPPVAVNPPENHHREMQDAIGRPRAEMPPPQFVPPERPKPSIREEEALRISVPIANASLNAGDKVLIKWGASWWHGKVVAIHPDGRIQVHYDGWSDNSDEAVLTDRIRIPTE
jgi:hypothetical protein